MTAVPFDLGRARDWHTVAIGGTVATEPMFYFAAVSASADGTLAVRPPPAVALVSAVMNTPRRSCVWLIATARKPREHCAALLVRHGAQSRGQPRRGWAILDPRAGTSDLSLMDLTKDTTVPLTTTHGFTAYPVWSVDGKRLAYRFQPPGGVDDV